jgi:hypothetical protein
MPNVFSVFATDASMKPSLAFNPEAIRGEGNFAFLGQDIRGQVPDNEPFNVSGTSIAAAVATGVAASLLDFSRQRICRDFMGNIGNMAAMSKIFSLMSVPDHGYDCVVPWRVLGLTDAMSGGTPDRGTQRMQLCEKLSQVGVLLIHGVVTC